VLLKKGGGMWVRCWADRKVGLEVALVVSIGRGGSTDRESPLAARYVVTLRTTALVSIQRLSPGTAGI
jgi:hypothetical protein